MSDAANPAGMDSAAVRARLAPAVASAAAFDGWGEKALLAAASGEGIEPSLARFAFETTGVRPLAMALITAWVAHIDAAMAREWPAERLVAMPMRARIRALVWFRLEQVMGLDEALRRALAVMALPPHVPQAARLGWQTADAMWRLAGDTATDYNHYTKRAILAGIYAATLGVFVSDRSDGKAETQAFLDRRIEGVMRFEKAKAKLLDALPADHFSLARFLGRLRYPGG